MTRLGNKKSRRGCIRCKKRRVKCDEVRPACGWCVVHSFDCEYINRTSLSSSIAGSESRSPIPAQSSTSTIVDRSRLELGLFQYYIYTVARGFPSLDKDRTFELHANIIPQASLRCSNLLNTMYAYALLHMQIQYSFDGKLPRNIEFFEDIGVQMKQSTHDNDILSLHRDYLHRALQGQRDVVSEINHKNADGICISALLLAQIALVHSSQMSDDYCVPSDWFRLQSSFSTCLAAARPLLTMDSATSILVHSAPVDNQDLDRQPTTLKALLEWQPEMNYQIREVYRKSIVYVETIQKRIAEKEPWQSLGRRILSFPNVGGSAFLALMEDHQPRALVVLAHVLAMARRLDYGHWVCRGVAEYHVRGIATIVPDEWQWALEWPMKVLETGAADDCFSAVGSPFVHDSTGP